MDIKPWANWLARNLARVLWFVVRNPFLIIRETIRWGFVTLFWLFVLGWGISAFAAEWTPAKNSKMYKNLQCTMDGLPVHGKTMPTGVYSDVAPCVSHFSTGDSSRYYAFVSMTPFVLLQGSTTNFRATVTWYPTNQGPSAQRTTPVTAVLSTYFQDGYTCPPDGKPDFTVGPKALNGQQVCEKVPVSCKVGEQLFMDSTTGAETCKPNCGSVAGDKLTDVAYNQAFLPSATVSCYGLCTVTSFGVTVGNTNTFEQFGNVQFTGEKCPVTFPNEGEGTPHFTDQPTSSQDTTDAQNQLQDAASSASGTKTPGATGEASLKDVVDKLAEISNKETQAQADQNAAMGKLIEGVGKDIQGAIKESAHGGGAGASIGQQQTANAIKEGNKTLKEISDKLDNQDQGEGEKPVAPGTSFDADASAIHEANDWGSRNFGTVLQANADRFKALPIFSAPTQFFTADFGGGSCPTYSGSFDLLGTSVGFQFDAFCSPAVLDVMPYIRAVVIMFFGWLAWRIAVGNGG